MADADALAREAIEPLLEDERLRGELSDAGFAPLLDWATTALSALAQEAATAPEAEARSRMAAARDAVRATIDAVVYAAQARTRRAALALLRDPLVARNPLARSRIAFTGFRLGNDADANAMRLTRALRTVRLEPG